MKTNQWAKTLLYTYKYLNRITDAIDKLVDRNAMNSFYFCSNNQKHNSVISVSNRIIELMERKKKLVNVKVLVDQSLLACDKLGAKILIEKFIDDDNAEEVALRHNLNIRTYFRRQDTAEKNFYANLVKLGYDERRLKEYLADERWIMEVYDKFQKESQEQKSL